MRAEDRLPDAVNESFIDGVSVRKGTVGAFLLNAKVWSDRTSSDEARIIAERSRLAASAARTRPVRCAEHPRRAAARLHRRPSIETDGSPD
jgi:hypothetical protein